MTTIKRTRYAYWFIKELFSKYTRSLFIGFLIGLVSALAFWRLQPVIARRFFIPTLHIAVIGEYTAQNLPESITSLVSTGLTKVNEDGSVAPALALTWEATDSGKLVVFHIRPDAVWHDGERVLAKDINYNIKNVTFSVIDEQTIAARLEEPYSPFPLLVSKPLFKTGLTGFGKYRVQSIRFKGESVQSLRLAPVDPSAGLKAREYTFFRTESTAITAYKLGKVDIIEEIADPSDLNDWGDQRIRQNVKSDRIVSLFFNLNNDLLKEKEVRQALGYALPELSDTKAISPISSTSWAYTDKVKRYEQDMENAAKLLKAAGIEPGQVELVISTFPSYYDTAQSIATAWNEAGIRTSVRVENFMPQDYQVLLSAIDIPPDPDQYTLWHSTQNRMNITGYANVKIDKLLEDGRMLTDTQERKKIYEDFQKRLVDDSPALFLYYPKTYTVIRKTANTMPLLPG